MNVQERFFRYRGWRWMWINLIAVVAMIAVYIYDSPLGGRNGGTVLGYIYGGLATAGILYLTWFGIRKRAYRAKHTTLQGTLAAHIWIGVALLIIVPLHSGFQFGINVHSLAYLLMVIVIVSGIWGAVNYTSLPPRIRAHRGGGSHRELVSRIDQFGTDIERLCEPERSAQFSQLVDRIHVPFLPGIKRYVFTKVSRSIDKHTAAELLAELPEDERSDAAKLIELVNERISLINQLQSDVAVLFWLRAWLYIHVPVTFALLVAVAVHIFSVFYYW